MPFRFTSNRVHLTYRSHISFPAIENVIENRCNKGIKHASYVHETSDQENTYDHTHVLLWFSTKLDTRNERIFDCEDVHPHIKAIRTDIQWDNTWNYHEKNPVLLRPDPHENPRQQHTDLLQKIKRARTLYQACTNAGIEIRTVQDVKSIRGDKAIIEDIPPPFPLEKFNREEMITGKSIIVHGTSGTGKTCYAMAHFKNPLVTSHIDDLKRFNAELHDGIIFDDMSFSHWPREACIHLLDYDFPRSINVKHSVVTIPAKTPKIFTHNYEDPMAIFPAEHRADMALKRRVRHTIYVTGSLIAETVAPPTTPTDMRLWENGQMIRDENGEPTLEVPFGLRNGPIFRSDISGSPIPSIATGHLDFDDDLIFNFEK